MLNGRKFKASHRGVRILGKGNCCQSSTVVPFSDISGYDTDEEIDEKTDDEIREEITKLSNGLNALKTSINLYLMKRNPTRQQNIKALKDIKIALNKYTKMKIRCEKINDIQKVNACNESIAYLIDSMDIVREQLN